jgi:hypothetical protein
MSLGVAAAAGVLFSTPDDRQSAAEIASVTVSRVASGS